MALPYYDREPSWELFSPREKGRVFEDYGIMPFVTHYEMSCAFLADAKFWSPFTRLSGLSQLGAQRLSAVSFPADKVLLSSSYRSPYTLDPSPASSMDSVEVVFAGWADGSAELNPEGGTRGMNTGDGADAERLAGGHRPGWGFGTHTRDGIRGTDR